jgi:tetratricopeptide (TPR) repeat protein
VVNVLEHAGAACLFWGVLRRLRVPGAFLAAALFVVHPVNVESVAWITEQKNTLSMVFYLGAAWCYLIFDAGSSSTRRFPWGQVTSRPPEWYAFALALFVMGLLTKTVTATLPAALLVVFWWQRGRVDLRRDVLPLLPWFAIGAAAGMFTAWNERVLIGAQGAEFELSPLQRTLLAGRVIWFYLYKLLVPIDQLFFYPRWTIDPSDWTWWVYLAGVIAVAAALAAIAVRLRIRAPLAAFLLFAGTLFPALGFFNVFPFRFSYVADHFQYHADLGILALVAAGAMRLVRLGPAAQRPMYAGAAAVVALLGVLSWKQSDEYGHDAVHHYRAMLEENPEAWIAYGNLAWLLVEKGQPDAAIPLFLKGLAINPQHFEALRDLGIAYERQGRLKDALPYYERALRVDPDPKTGENLYGGALMRGGRGAEAIPHLTRATELAAREGRPIPRFHRDLGLGYIAVGRLDEAVAELQAAHKLAGGDYPAANAPLADALVGLKRYDEAFPYLERAIEEDPDDAIHRYDVGRILFNKGQYDAACPYLEDAIRLRPDLVDAYIVLALARFELDQRIEARAAAESGLRAARSLLPPDAVRSIEQTLAPVLDGR